jgi:hypothetical protein
MRVETQNTGPVATEVETWLTRKELSARIKVNLNTLNQWASLGKGPRFAKFGRHVRYAIADVLAWEQDQFAGIRD